MSKEFKFNRGPLDAVEASSPRDMALSAREYGIYLTEKTQRFVLGTRYITWDGRVFKYCLSNNTCNPTNGALNDTVPFIADDGTNEVVNSTIVGDTSITADDQTVAEDALAGGFVIIYSTYEQTRGIIGNTVGAGTDIEIYLDAPLTVLTTGLTTDFCAYYSPYYGLKNNEAVARASVMCIPCTWVSAASMFFWGQTWGPCRISPGAAGYGDDSGERMLVFGENGSTFIHNDAAAVTLQNQHAGFIIPKTLADDAPLTMLQISV